MWIIVEGVDGSGKSTLCDRLADEIPTAVRTHLSAPKSPSSALSECVDDKPFDVYKPGSGLDLISDRHHWGCPVYGPILRPEHDEDGYGDMGMAGWRYAELYVMSRGGVTVFVDVDAEIAQERIRARGDSNYPTEVLVAWTPELVDRYRWLIADAPTMGLHVHAPPMDALDALAESIVLFGRTAEDAARPLAEHADYVGSIQPKTLIVCEPTKEARLRVLAELGDDWADYGFCSSEKSRDQLHHLAGVLDYPQILGVGTMPGDADAFVYDMSGTIVESLRDAAII